MKVQVSQFVANIVIIEIVLHCYIMQPFWRLCVILISRPDKSPFQKVIGQFCVHNIIDILATTERSDWCYILQNKSLSISMLLFKSFKVGQ